MNRIQRRSQKKFLFLVTINIVIASPHAFFRPKKLRRTRSPSNNWPQEDTLHSETASNSIQERLLETAPSEDTPIETYGEEAEDENPWPHVSQYYAFLGRKESQLKFLCLACRPTKSVMIRAHISTLCNLRAHMQRVHPQLHGEFRAVLSVCRGKKG
jgi:hypothetical protein